MATEEKKYEYNNLETKVLVIKNIIELLEDKIFDYDNHIANDKKFRMIGIQESINIIEKSTKLSLLESRLKWKKQLIAHFGYEGHVSLFNTDIYEYIFSTYNTFEINQKILDRYNMNDKHNPVVAEEYSRKIYPNFDNPLSGHYDNLLLLSACIACCTEDKIYKQWKEKYIKMYKSLFPKIYGDK